MSNSKNLLLLLRTFVVEDEPTKKKPKSLISSAIHGTGKQLNIENGEKKIARKGHDLNTYTYARLWIPQMNSNCDCVTRKFHF